MILKKLIAMCKKNKIISMFEDSQRGLKWLSAGSVAVCLGGDCPFTTDDILFFLEIPEEKKTEYFIKHERDKALPNTAAAEDVERLEYSLNIHGDPLQPFKTSQGILFINMKLLAIFADIEEVTYKFAYWNNVPVLLVMEYSELKGIIPPMKMDYDKLLDFADELCSLSGFAKSNGFLSIDGKQVSIFDNEE